MMTTSPPRRDPWRVAWQPAVGDVTLAVLLVGLAAGLLIADRLPQMPGSAAPADYAQWLSEAQAHFGPATDTLRALGFFSITRSFPFRALVSLLGGSLLLRTVAGLLALRQKFAWKRLFSVLACGGGMVLLVALLLTHLWGRQIKGIILQDGGRITLTDEGKWVALRSGSGTVIHSPGLVASIESRGPGVQVTAADRDGPLFLRLPNGEPTDRLTIPLTEDRYFAITEAHLVVRLSPRRTRGSDGEDAVLVQVYHSPSGILALEKVIEEDAVMEVGGVRLTVTCLPYVQLTVASNPGLGPGVAGVFLLLVGTAGQVVEEYLSRRREGAEKEKAQ